MALIRLIYVSHPFGFEDGTLVGILLDARRANARDGITGALISRHDLFLQYLEGPAEAVDAAFARIRRDDRHVDIRLIERAEITQRLFPEWAMRDDPAASVMWSREEVHSGAADRATPAEVLAIFEKLAKGEVEPPKVSRCPFAHGA